MAQTVKRLPTMWETRVQSLGQEDLLEKEMATHSSNLAWKIPWLEEPGRLQSMGPQRVGHDWAASVSLLIVYPGSSPSSVLFQKHWGAAVSMSWSDMKVAQSYLTLCNPMHYRVHGILQARILEWIAIPFSRASSQSRSPSSQPRDRTQVSRIAGGFFTHWATRKTHKLAERR